MTKAGSTHESPDFLPFGLPDLGEAEVQAVAEVIRSGWVTSGPQMREFETEFAQFVGGKVEAVAVNSATAGLHLALEALGIGAGDEVIVPDWTFTATAEVVRYMGATPVIVDVHPQTLAIDPDAAARAVTPRTRAVIPVHFGGLPVDLATLRAALGSESIAIVEDAAHSLPAVGPDGPVGSCQQSDAAVFSFYATKTITTGEGGMICTRDPQLAARCRTMRLHGIDRDAFDRYTSTLPAWAYDVVAAGFKYNLPDMAAAMGRVQLARAHQMRDRREQIAEHYLAQFANLGLELPVAAPPGQLHSWHLFVVRLPADAPLTRDAFIEAMSTRGIGTSVHFIPLHEHSYWKPFADSDASGLRVARSVASSVVSLPIYSAMDDSQVERVVQAVRSCLAT